MPKVTTLRESKVRNKEKCIVLDVSSVVCRATAHAQSERAGLLCSNVVLKSNKVCVSSSLAAQGSPLVITFLYCTSDLLLSGEWQEYEPK